MSKRKWTNEEVAEYRKTHGSPYYFNPQDANLYVPKVYGFGRTLNWANPISWLILAAAIAFIVWKTYPRIVS